MTLLPDTDFSMKARNLTIYFVTNLDYFKYPRHSVFILEDTDTLLQLMVFLRQKLLRLEGTKFYVVITENQKDTNVELMYRKLGFEVVLHDLSTEISNKTKRVFIAGKDLKTPFMNPYIEYLTGGSSYYPNFRHTPSSFTVYPEDVLTDRSLKSWMELIVRAVNIHLWRMRMKTEL